MKTVFESTNISTIQLNNRIFRSATHEAMGEKDGRPMQELENLYVNLAKGQVGAIITGFTAIQRNGRPGWNVRMFDMDDYIEDYRKINMKVKKYDVPIILQLAHCGGLGLAEVIGERPVAPSPVKAIDFPSKPRQLSKSEIIDIIQNFINAIQRAKEAQFDGVQLHAAHGYLLSEFLSPHINRRSDKWGGTTKNRFQILSEIIRGAKDIVGDFPVFVKMNAYEGTRRGMRIEESLKIARYLEESGVDCIEVSCGAHDGLNTTRMTKVPVDAAINMVPIFTDLNPVIKKIVKLAMPFVFTRHTPINNYNLSAAKTIKQSVSIPVIAVGGIRDLGDIEKAIAEDQADFVSMSRPFIIEPSIVKKFKLGQQRESRCINCGYCMMGCMSAPLRCYYGKLKNPNSTV